MTDTWIILGASSTIAKAFTRSVAEAGAHVILAGRRMDDLEASAADASARGAVGATPVAFDARDPETFQPILDAAVRTGGTINCAVFVGSMPSQDDINDDPALVDGTIADSFTGPARFLQMLAPLMSEQGSGSIVGVGSVAGDRGRVGNYVYGAAKAGFATYLSGLRNQLGRSGVHVLTVKPGPVDTVMTQGLGDQPFMTTADAVVADIHKALSKKRNTLYTKWIWWPVMTVIKLIPEPIFKKMSI
ncbi:SDR family NAD(P)-dependent oxidoreductase [Octadecabacter sp. 1_MG-2023]|uniref:SDR family NAD(P)-dependent oxidoreductase n=1 Tax=unclassified Octadecabacter TaxID=196158 RepID=UPI001C09D9E6|nr:MULTISPECIES: SDR family NAD(P)-dependent oxidoreductase [unclassified Octadecabacter]MBU2992008.1 SDR family NAD(P)-dependent oxidoreductase [Octadecabacter sp. B2R22]MDO6735983.1 SDR family NAD(P)-dependent oxidoreductase [Octadecabacter sp. 1_MG-2023]